LFGRRWRNPQGSPHRPDRRSTAAVGAVVHLQATAIEGGRDPSWMGGILADSYYRLLQA